MANAVSEMLTNRQMDHKIWRIAGPAILANSAAPLVGLVDTGLVGHLPGPTALAALGVGVSFFNFIFWGFGFLRMATTGLIAQAFGSGDISLVRDHTLRSMGTGLILALLIVTTASPMIIPLAIKLLGPGPNVIPQAETYIWIRLWATPAVFITFSSMAFFIAMGRTMTALILQIILNVVNLVLNLIFVIVLDMGIAGIALGSVIAEYVTLISGIVMVSKSLPESLLSRRLYEITLWNNSHLQKLFNVSSFLFLRTLLLIFAFGYVTRTAADLGEVALAASQILITFSVLIALGLDGLAYAGEALVGQYYGRRDPVLFHQAVVRAGLWSFVVAVLYAAIFLSFGETIIGLLTDIQDVREITVPLVPLLALTPIIGFASYHFDGVYVGMTAAAAMLITMAFAVIAYVIAVQVLVTPYGLIGLWVSFLIFLTARALGQLAYYPWLKARCTPPA